MLKLLPLMEMKSKSVVPMEEESVRGNYMEKILPFTMKDNNYKVSITTFN